MLEHPKPVSEEWEEATHKLERELWGCNIEQHEPDALQHDLLLQCCILCQGCGLVQQLDRGVRRVPNAGLLDCCINVAGQDARQQLCSLCLYLCQRCARALPCMLGCCNLVIAQLELTLQRFGPGQSRLQHSCKFSCHDSPTDT